MIIYREFMQEEDASDIIDLLKKNHISFKMEKLPEVFDNTFIGGSQMNSFQLKIEKQDYENVESLLADISMSDADHLDKDYYLYSFTDDELMEILVKKDEWGPIDYSLAKKLLKDRGKEVDEIVLNSLINVKKKEMTKPEPSPKTMIYSGYFFAILGGLIGIFIGLHLKSSKKTLSDGKIIYSFSEEDRLHGKRIFYTGIIGLFFWVILREYFKYLHQI